MRKRLRPRRCQPLYTETSIRPPKPRLLFSLAGRLREEDYLLSPGQGGEGGAPRLRQRLVALGDGGDSFRLGASFLMLSYEGRPSLKDRQTDTVPTGLRRLQRCEAMRVTSPLASHSGHASRKAIFLNFSKMVETAFHVPAALEKSGVLSSQSHRTHARGHQH